jgi:hypothetical protein
MLRLACDTDPMKDVADRIAAGAQALTAHGPAIDAGEPWPLSAAYGTEPEADWGPKEVLAHVAEMIPYWLAEIERVVGGGEGPVPFGRVASDTNRIDRIGRDRVLPAPELLKRIEASAGVAAQRLRELDDIAKRRVGLHPRLGQLSVEEIAERFVAAHLVDHDEQLRSILEGRAAGRST